MLNLDDLDGVLVVALDHGKVNALDFQLLDEIATTFAGVPRHRPIVITGAGRAFSAGVDLNTIADADDSALSTLLHLLSDAFQAVFDHPGPVIAAINGPAIAGGCVLAAACDRRIMSQGPIGLAELAVGVPFPTVALEIMRGLLGPRTADLLLTARLLDAQQALAVGLVDEVVAPAKLLARAAGQASLLGAIPADVFTFTKRQLQSPVRDRMPMQRADDPTMRSLWLSPAVRGAVREYSAQLRAAADHPVTPDRRADDRS